MHPRRRSRAEFGLYSSKYWIPSFVKRESELKSSQALMLHVQCTVKPVLSGHSQIDKTKILMTSGSLMKVKSIEAPGGGGGLCSLDP